MNSLEKISKKDDWYFEMPVSKAISIVDIPTLKRLSKEGGILKETKKKIIDRWGILSVKQISESETVSEAEESWFDSPSNTNAELFGYNILVKKTRERSPNSKKKIFDWLSLKGNNRKDYIHGIRMLKKLEINPEKYRKYFKRMRDYDVPVINKLPNFDFIEENNNSLTLAKRDWNFIKEAYDGLKLKKNISRQTGEDIIQEMKKEFEIFDNFFKKYLDDNEGKTNLSEPSSDLRKSRSRIIKLSRRFGKLPAYKAYRYVGRFEFNPEGRRKFQDLRN